MTKYLESNEFIKDKIEVLADIIAPITLDLRYCDCIQIAKKLFELDLIKEFDNGKQ